MRAANFPDRKLTEDEFLRWVDQDLDAKFEFDDGLAREKTHRAL